MKYRLVRLEMMASALVPDAVLLTAAGAAVVAFTDPSAAGSFDHKSKGKKRRWSDYLKILTTTTTQNVPILN